jgi:hypothetical protein
MQWTEEKQIIPRAALLRELKTKEETKKFVEGIFTKFLTYKGTGEGPIIIISNPEDKPWPARPLGNTHHREIYRNRTRGILSGIRDKLNWKVKSEWSLCAKYLGAGKVQIYWLPKVKKKNHGNPNTKAVQHA